MPITALAVQAASEYAVTTGGRLLANVKQLFNQAAGISSPTPIAIACVVIGLYFFYRAFVAPRAR